MCRHDKQWVEKVHENSNSIIIKILFMHYDHVNLHRSNPGAHENAYRSTVYDIKKKKKKIKKPELLSYMISSCTIMFKFYFI